MFYTEPLEDYSECIALGTSLKMGGDPTFRDCKNEPCHKYCSMFKNPKKLPENMKVTVSDYLTLIWREEWVDCRLGVSARTFLPMEEAE